MSPSPIADDDPRLALLRLLGLARMPADPALCRIARLAVASTGWELALVVLVAGDAQWVHGCAGAPVPSQPRLGRRLRDALTLGAGPLEIEDAARDPRLAAEAPLPELPALAACAAQPLALDGLVIGGVLLFGPAGSRLDDARRAVLADLVATAQALLQSRHEHAQLEARQQRLRESAELGQRSEERYRRIVETAEEGIWLIDAAGVTTFVNPKMASMLGYEVLEMLGRPLLAFMDDDARDQARTNLRRREDGIAEQHDFRLRRKDGGPLWTAMSTSLLQDDRGGYAGALAMVTDITQRRAAEEALRASEERFRSLMVLSSDWYWEQDEEFRLTRMAGGRAFDADASQRRAVGLRPWEAASSLMEPAVWDEHRRTLEAHLPFRDFEIMHEQPDGRLNTISVSGEPVFAADGTFTGYRGVGRDITAQRREQAERLALEAQLRESQKLEAIGSLAGGIAHDFNNVLAGILGNAALAMQDLLDVPGAAAALASLEQIERAGLRGRGLVQQILAFARRQPREVVNCELPPQDPLYVMADATQVEQVLVNLCTNAWHSLAGRPGRVVVALAPVEMDAGIARGLGLGLAPGRYVRLSVQDNGQGMSAHTRARIFEPFFTTKPPGEGTGLGLAVAHGIVAAHGGAIHVLTAEGLGSTFEIYLPRVAAAPPPERPATVPPPRRGHGERVLYVDDDEVMGVMVERLLARLGYAPTCLRDPLLAVAAVRAAPQDFDIVVTDLNMPEMSGLEVARELRELRADLPVVISSGNLPEELQAQARELGVRGLVHKQFTLEELGAVVHWVLAGEQRLGLEPLQLPSR